MRKAQEAMEVVDLERGRLQTGERSQKAISAQRVRDDLPQRLPVLRTATSNSMRTIGFTPVVPISLVFDRRSEENPRQQ